MLILDDVIRDLVGNILSIRYVFGFQLIIGGVFDIILRISKLL